MRREIRRPLFVTLTLIGGGAGPPLPAISVTVTAASARPQTDPSTRQTGQIA